MRHILRYASVVFLLVLVAATGSLAAQDEAQVSVVGSGVGNALIESLLPVSSTESIEMKTIGTTAGIKLFCSGGVEMASALRPIRAAEVADCISHEVDYSEFLIAHKIVAFATHDSIPANCISRSQLEAFVKPSVSNQQLDWSEFTDEDDAPPFALLIPAADTLEYDIVDELVVGDRLRRDAIPYADQADAIALLGEVAGSLAVLPYSASLATNEEVKMLGFQNDDAAACVEPSADNVELKTYTAAQSIYAYVNREHLDANDYLFDLVESLIDESNEEGIVALGYAAPSLNRLEINANVLSDPEASTLLSDGDTDFEIPPSLTGEIGISGVANVHQLLKRISDNLTSDHVQLLVSIEASDSAVAVSELCSGEINIAMVDMQIIDDSILPCELDQASIVSLPIGAQATVLLGNSADAFSQCLTLDHITTIWIASGDETLSFWSDLEESFPSREIMLFGTSTVDRNADMLLARTGQVTPPIRRDTEADFDPLYRAAAVANVTGSLTYMSWQDYERVVANEQENVRLVGIDAGSGCVLPEEESILNGAYALSRPANLLVDQVSLADVNVQSLLWSLYTDVNWSIFEREGFVGIALADLAAHRRQLETQFRLAEANVFASESAAESESSVDGDADDSG